MIFRKLSENREFVLIKSIEVKFKVIHIIYYENRQIYLLL